MRRTIYITVLALLMVPGCTDTPAKPPAATTTDALVPSVSPSSETPKDSSHPLAAAFEAKYALTGEAYGVPINWTVSATWNNFSFSTFREDVEIATGTFDEKTLLPVKISTRPITPDGTLADDEVFVAHGSDFSPIIGASINGMPLAWANLVAPSPAITQEYLNHVGADSRITTSEDGTTFTTSCFACGLAVQEFWSQDSMVFPSVRALTLRDTTDDTVLFNLQWKRISPSTLEVAAVAVEALSMPQLPADREDWLRIPPLGNGAIPDAFDDLISASDLMSLDYDSEAAETTYVSLIGDQVTPPGEASGQEGRIRYISRGALAEVACSRSAVVAIGWSPFICSDNSLGPRQGSDAQVSPLLSVESIISQGVDTRAHWYDLSISRDGFRDWPAGAVVLGTVTCETDDSARVDNWSMLTGRLLNQEFQESDICVLRP